MAPNAQEAGVLGAEKVEDAQAAGDAKAGKLPEPKHVPGSKFRLMASKFLHPCESLMHMHMHMHPCESLLHCGRWGCSWTCGAHPTCLYILSFMCPFPGSQLLK